MAFNFGSIPFGDILKGAGSIFGALSESDAAKRAAKAGTPTPFGVQGPAGSFSVQNGQLNLAAADNPFARLFNAIGGSSLANAATAPGSFLFGADPQIAEAYKGLFGQGLTDRISGQLDLLREAAAPEENRQRLSLDNQLFARGQLGTTGGAERFRALTEAQNQADRQRQLAAIGLGRTEALDRFQGALQGVQQGMAGQNQAFNIGAGSFNGLQGLFQNLLNQGQLGLGAAAGVPPQLAAMQAQASQSPFQAGFNFLNQGGFFDRLNPRPSVQFPAGQSNLLGLDLGSLGITGDFGL